MAAVGNSSRKPAGESPSGEGSLGGCTTTNMITYRVSISAVTIRIPVFVEGVKLQAVVDSGAEVSVLSSARYLDISSESRPSLLPSSVNLLVAEQGRTLHTEGFIQARVQIDQVKFQSPLHVAPISEDLLLGSDILDSQDIVVSSRRGLQIGSKWVPCEVKRRCLNVCRAEVAVPETVDIQPHHEMVIPVPVPDVLSNEPQETVLEPIAEDTRGLIIARSLVDPSIGVIPIRMANLGDQPIRLRKGQPVGVLEPVEAVASVGAPSTNIRMVGAKWGTEKTAPRPDNKLACSRTPDDESIAATTDEDYNVKNDSASSLRVDEKPSAATIEAEAELVPEHLQSLYTSTAADVHTAAVRLRLKQLLIRRQGAFARHKLDLGNFSEIKHEIDTGFAAPVKQRVRPTPRGFEGEEKKCIEDQLEAGVIRPSSSPWAAPTVLVRKSDGSVRFCIDYRKLNDRTRKDAYPLPKISLCLDSLGGSRFFTTLDLQSGYWQISMAEDDIPKTAFITKYGLFEYTKMPFGLCSAGSTFQRCVELIMRGLQWQTILIYLDDIIVIGRSMEENLMRLEEVLERLEKAGLKLKPSKCQILQREVLFLGHLVSELGVQPNPRLIESVKSWPVPTDRKGVQQYLGLVNYYRRFVPRFSDIAEPLTSLTSKEVEFQWGDEAQSAFDALKEALCTAPVLSFPLDEGDFILDTDASAVGIGAVLQQVQDNEEKVIAYGSKKLSRQQRRYCVTRRELLAIVVFLREFRNYLLGKPFTIRTDHGSLTWLLHFKEPQGQLARWIEYIYQFKFVIVHREGRKHANADALSRIPTPQGTCDQYRADVQLHELPCGGCRHCTARDAEWSTFLAEVDDVVPLNGACRRIETRSPTKRHAKKLAEVKPSGPNVSSGILGPSETNSPAHAPPVRNWTGRSMDEIRSAQQNDPEMRQVREWVVTQTKPSREVAASLSPATRAMWLNFEMFELREGILFLKWVDNSLAQKPTLRLAIPKDLRTQVLTLCHDSVFSGHLGVRKTILLARPHC